MIHLDHRHAPDEPQPDIGRQISQDTGDVIRVRLIGTSGNIDPNAELVRPNGTTLCGPTRHDEFTCTVDTTGAHAVFLRDFWGTRTGGFALSLQRLNDPQHCTALSPGAPPLIVRVGVPGETSCFTFPPSAAGDSVHVRLIRVSGDIDPHAELVRPNGTTLCGPTRSDEFTCQIDLAGHHALHVRDFWGGRTGEFSVAFAIAGSNPPPPPSPVDGPGDPIIEFTFVPPYGSSLDLKGKVSHVVPAAYHVAVYIRVGAGWWTKPYWSRPATPISADGTWSCDITTGGFDQRATEIVAFLIPATYSPPLASGQATLPAGIEAAAVARIAVTRTP